MPVPSPSKPCGPWRSSVCLAVGWLALWAAPAIAVDRMEAAPDQLQDVGLTEHFDAQAPLDLPFVDSGGEQVTLGKFFDGTKPVLLTMNYSRCPRLCSLQLNGLFRGLQELDWDMGDKFQMVTVSIDPEESPQRAQETKDKYLESYGRAGVSGGWHYVTGQEKNIRKVADTVGFSYVYVEETKEFAHTAVTIILTPDGRVSRYLYGIEYDPRTLKLALIEAGEGKIGTPTEKLLLYCFYYDSESGRYGPYAVRIMQLGAIFTALIFGSVLSIYWIKDFFKSRLPNPLAAQDHSVVEDRAGGFETVSQSQKTPNQPEEPTS